MLKARPVRLDWLFLFLMTSIGLSACKPASITPMSVTNSSALTRAPAVSDDNSGIVVIGQGLLWEKASFSLENENCSVFSTRWLPMGQNVPEEFSQGFVTTKSGCLGNNAPAVAYNILKIPPGRYAFSEYVHRLSGNYSLTTHLFQKSEQPEYEQVRSPKFTVAKGEVIYIGDFYFAYLKPSKDSVLPASQSHPKPVAWRKDEAAARKALGAFGIDPDQMVSKAPN